MVLRLEFRNAKLPKEAKWTTLPQLLWKTTFATAGSNGSYSACGAMIGTDLLGLWPLAACRLPRTGKS
jgi:hypothetical protein